MSVNVMTSATRLVGNHDTPNDASAANLFSVDDIAEYLAQVSFLGKGVYNVMDPTYGAKGDGTTDDTAAIQAALNAAPEGTAVFIPPGKFLISSTLTVSKKIKIFGNMGWWNPASGSASEIHAGAGVTKAISLSNSGAMLQDLLITGNGATGTNIAVGIDSSYCLLDRVSIPGGFSIGVQDNKVAAKSWTYLIDCMISGCDIAWDLFGNHKIADRSTFYLNRISCQVGSIGNVTNFHANRCEFQLDNTIDSTTGTAVLLASRVIGWSVTDCYMEFGAAGHRAIRANAGALFVQGGSVTGNYFQGNSLAQYCIAPQNASTWTDCDVRGNYFVNFTAAVFNANGKRTQFGVNAYSGCGLAVAGTDLSPYCPSWIDENGVQHGLTNPQNTQTSTAGVGNGADSTDDTLFAFSLPANTLTINGQSVRVKGYGTTAANANNKTIKVFFGVATAISSGAVALNAQNWEVEVMITRVGAAAVSVLSKFTSNGASSVVNILPNTAVSNLTTNALTLKVTGASAASAANDVLGYGMKTWLE